MRRLPIYLLLDCSEAMSGEPIEAVRQGIKALLSDLNSVPLAIDTAFLSAIIFNNSAKQVCPLTELIAFKEPCLTTNKGCALGEALKLLEECIGREVIKSTPYNKGDFNPLVFLILGGMPSDRWEHIADRIKQKKSITITACIAGSYSNLSIFKRLTDNFVDLNNIQPDTLKYFFRWVEDDIPLFSASSLLSKNMSVQTHSEVSYNNENKELQNLIEATREGGTIELVKKEYAGPVIIKKSITLNGKGASIWDLKGPVIIIESPGVTLRNLSIEVTGDGIVREIEQCAIIVKSSQGIEFENVEIRGLVTGLYGEQGEWYYPKSLNLGNIKADSEYKFLLKIVVPVTCNITSNIFGLEVYPQNLFPGLNEINIHIEPISNDILLNGNITLSTEHFKRKIMVNAYVVDEESAVLSYYPHMVIWEPANYLSSKSNFISSSKSTVEKIKDEKTIFFIEEVIIFSNKLKERVLHFTNSGDSIGFFRDVKLPEGIHLFYGDKKIPVGRNNIRDFIVRPGKTDYFTAVMNDNYQEMESFAIFTGQDNRRHRILIHIFQPQEVIYDEFVFGIALDIKGLSIYCRDIKKWKYEEVFYEEKLIDITNKNLLVEIANLIITKILECCKDKSTGAKFHYVFALPIFDGKELYFLESVKIQRILLSALSQIHIKENIHFISGPQAMGFYFLEQNGQGCEAPGDIVCLYDLNDNNIDLIFMKLRDKAKKIDGRLEILGITGLYHDKKNKNVSLSEVFYQLFKWFQMKKNLKEDSLKYVFISGNNGNGFEHKLNTYFGDKLKMESRGLKLHHMAKGASLAFNKLFSNDYSISWNLTGHPLINRDIVFASTFYVKEKEVNRILNNNGKHHIRCYLNINDIPYRIGYSNFNGSGEHSNRYILTFKLSQDNEILIYSTELASNVRNCLFKYNLTRNISQEE